MKVYKVVYLTRISVKENGELLVVEIMYGGVGRGCGCLPLSCVNCQGPHASFHGSCPVHKDIIASLRPPRDHEVPDAPLEPRLPSPPPVTPMAPRGSPSLPATPARQAHQQLAPSETSQPETVRLVRRTSSLPTLATPLPQRNLFGVGRSLFPANPSADWSEPNRPDEEMEL